MPATSAMTRTLPLRACLCAAAVLVAACATPPQVRLHTLMPAETLARAAATAAATGGPREPVAIVLEPIRLPPQVDQPQWLVRLGDDSMARLEQERWASPLRDELRQALVESLAVRHGAVEGRPAAGRESSRITVDVRRFESIPGREARIEGAWTVQAGRAAALRCDFAFREPAPGAIDAIAVAHQRAVQKLADAIGVALRAAPGGCT